MSHRFLIVLFALCFLISCAPGNIPASETPTSIIPSTTYTPEPTPTATPYPANTVAFYRLQIKYETTSDWSTLDLLTPENILAVRTMNVSGTLTSYQAGIQQIALNQALAASEAGKRISITVDYAVAPEALDQPLQFRLQKGDIGDSAVNIFNVTSGTAELVQSLDHKGVVNNSAGLNPKEFSVDLTALKNSSPLLSKVGTTVQPKMLLAFYYTWYSMKDWTSDMLRDRPLVRYSSNSPQAMTRQIEEAQSAGIDGFISSWWGPGSDTDQNLKTLLEVAQEKNFKININFETLAGPNEGPLDPATIQDWLVYAIKNYGDDPAFIKVNGKPLIVIWASGTVPLDSWKSIFASLHNQGLDAVYLAMGYDLNNLDVFDGVHDYGIFTYKDLTQTYRSTSSAVRNYSLLADQPTQKIWVATVQPGYDERNIPGRAGLVQDRQNGNFYRSTWDAALQSNPDWIFITTWNEWWEHTHIEPSELYGDQYLQITREYADKWKAKQ
ncbi:MAG: glycoside hydrolase family 99-like domain-containing protein [Chloroflexi bacterium]|nr:glycoside hydrolase family 99-like domain-containing protein [Chloroflexota bacterium]